MKKKNSTIPANPTASHFIADETVEVAVEKKAKKVVVLEPAPEVAPEPAPAAPVEEVKAEEVAAATEEVK